MNIDLNRFACVSVCVCGTVSPFKRVKNVCKFCVNICAKEQGSIERHLKFVVQIN